MYIRYTLTRFFVVFNSSDLIQSNILDVFLQRKKNYPGDDEPIFVWRVHDISV